METIKFQIKGQAGQTFCSPLGNYEVTLDRDGVGEAPADCGIFDDQGNFLLGKSSAGILLEGTPATVVLKDGVLSTTPGGLAKWKALKDFAKGTTCTTPKFGLEVKHSASGIVYAPIDCGFLDLPLQYELIGEIEEGDFISEDLLPKKNGQDYVEVYDDVEADILDGELSDEEIDRILLDQAIAEAEKVTEDQLGEPVVVDDAGEEPAKDELEDVIEYELLDKTRSELEEIAKELGVEKIYTYTSKDSLAEAIRSARAVSLNDDEAAAQAAADALKG